jgi:hypothetical protein
MDGTKKTRQIAFRLDADLYARFEGAARRDKISIASLVRRIAEWALPQCEKFGSIVIVEDSRVVPLAKWPILEHSDPQKADTTSTSPKVVAARK